MRYFSGLFAILPPFLGYAVGVCEIFLHKISVRVSPPGRCKVRVSRYSPPSFLIAPRAAVSSSSPDAEPYVKAGDTVKKGQILGIIEAMKLMNEIESEYDGVVEAVLVNNEDVVEYGQPLFRIK